MNKFEISKWTGVAIIFLIILGTAIYAMTTWGTSVNSTSGSGRNGSGLIDQGSPTDLQAQPQAGQGLNGGSDSSQLQQGTGTEQGGQSSRQIYYPDHDQCRGIYPASDGQIECVNP